MINYLKKLYNDIRNPQLTLIEIDENDSYMKKELLSFMYEFDKDNIDIMADYQDVFTDRPRPNVDYMFGENRILWMIQYGRKNIGFVNIVFDRREFMNGIGIKYIFITKNYRNKGYGKQILSMVLNIIRADYPDKTQVALNVLSCNTAAKKVYRDLGFEPVSEVMKLKLK